MPVRRSDYVSLNQVLDNSSNLPNNPRRKSQPHSQYDHRVPFDESNFDEDGLIKSSLPLNTELRNNNNSRDLFYYDDRNSAGAVENSKYNDWAPSRPGFYADRKSLHSSVDPVYLIEFRKPRT